METVVIIWHQPKLHELLYRKSLKITIPAIVWSPENGEFNDPCKVARRIFGKKLHPRKHPKTQHDTGIYTPSESMHRTYDLLICQSLVYSRVPTEAQGLENCPIKKTTVQHLTNIIRGLISIRTSYLFISRRCRISSINSDMFAKNVQPPKALTWIPRIICKEKSLVPHLLLLVHRALPTLLPCAPHQKGTNKSSNWRFQAF